MVDHVVELVPAGDGQLQPDPKAVQRRGPAPTIPTPAATAARLPGSWSYLPDFIAMSSPNHLACS